MVETVVLIVAIVALLALDFGTISTGVESPPATAADDPRRPGRR